MRMEDPDATAFLYISYSPPLCYVLWLKLLSNLKLSSINVQKEA